MTIAGMLLLVAGGVLIWSGVTGRSMLELLRLEPPDTDTDEDADDEGGGDDGE